MSKKASNINHPFIVWAACILWLISIFAILWSLLLFFGTGDVLFLTGTDLVNAVVLLSGVIMLPTNLYIVYAVAKGDSIELRIVFISLIIVMSITRSQKLLLPLHTAAACIRLITDERGSQKYEVGGEIIGKDFANGANANVLCCRLRTCVIWIMAINAVGIVFCIQRVYCCYDMTMKYIASSMRQYRTMYKHKRFIDNLQWSLGCCGLHSYTDWFTQDWHDKVRDYEWSPPYSRDTQSLKDSVESDSVPLSCCKSGSCVSNYLKELGTFSINTSGCGNMMYRIIVISMSVHITMFLLVIVLEGLLLKYSSSTNSKKKSLGSNLFRSKSRKSKFNIRNIMSVNDNFEISSESYRCNEESDDIDSINLQPYQRKENDEK